MKAEYHIHTHFSGDCETPMEAQVQAALDAHIDILCFTEHLDEDYPHDCLDFSLDVPAYRKGFEEIRDKYQDRIKLLFGVELGLQPHLGAFYQDFCQRYPFDFVIGSTHVSSRIDPYFPEYWEGRTAKESMEHFYSDTLEHIRSTNCFDSLGHLDYAIRHIPASSYSYSCFDFMDLIDECLKLLIHRGQALEVNTGGYKNGLNSPHPCFDILKRYKELGGELLTIGSDAHLPEFVGYCYDKAISIIRECGFRHLTVYEKRVGRQIPL